MATDLPRIYLTGGSGFIGCQLARYAVERGYPVTVTSAVNNDTERRRIQSLERSGLRVTVVSLDDEAALARSLAGHDVVIHLAAAQHEAQAPESHFRRVNVEGTRRLLETSIAAGVRRFVHGSTIGVYGAARDGVLDETSPLAPDNSYGRTKAEAELVVRSCAPRIETSIVRISETYGPADMRLLKLFRAIERGRYLTLGRGTNEHQLIYVDDLAEGLLAAATSPRAVGETFVIAGDERLTTDAMAQAIAASLGQTRSPPHVPLWPFAAGAVLCEALCKPLGVKPPLNRRRLDFFRKSFRFSTAKARERLDFEPHVPFAEGARRTADWYRANAMLQAAPPVMASTPPRQSSC
ncbi:MAG TPA: NAD-dependent epimerase/dehydratase family protein [Steroidobacteraceae bacterium]|nr:NAD-dependent epimerase/dehydratase family protein [Steroidobacteraceae bacterium]